MDNRYIKLKRERLLFDPAYYLELQSRYSLNKRKYISLVILAIALVFAGGVIVTVNETALSNSLPINEISSILLSMALYCIVYVIGIVESYVILLKSEERMDKVYMRLRRKIRKKLDD